ncbi:hypothetical protein KR767_05515 [Luteibacter anthropi]|uniref:hypothetical protein n=1 Tax=Luteibacter anthropi TaxID=564369 RepID=UPI0020326670|nr:hypothetical protein [Luteibacter anthropi]URX63524.1 hypothetical protein KR767_05515 [Luteibacter anthropi]
MSSHTFDNMTQRNSHRRNALDLLTAVTGKLRLGGGLLLISLVLITCGGAG